MQRLDRERFEPVVIFYEDNSLIPRFEKAARVVVCDLVPKAYRPAKSFSDAVRYIPRFFKYVLFKQLRLLKILKEIDPDLVHLNNGYFCCHEWMLACRLRGIRVITHDRGGQPPVSAQTRLFSRLLDAGISVSDHFLDIVRREGLRPRIACRIYNGIDPSLYGPTCSPESRTGTRRELGTDENEILVGLTGNITPWKGQLVFVKAMREIIGRGYAAKGVIIGKTISEDYEREVRRYISDHGLGDRISILGFRKDVPALLCALDVAGHASVEPEPFGRVILEAKLMARPVIATDGGGAAEQIEHGVTGLLVPMGDEAAMAEAIEEYMSDMDRASRLGEQARRDAEENYTLEKMVRETEKVYDRVLSLS